MAFDRKAGEHDLAAVLTLELLFRTEMDFVMNTARRCGLSDADAEDVTQQVFLALQRRLHTLQSPESVRPWLQTVTRRRAATLLAAHREEPTATLPDDIGELEDEGPLVEEQMLASEQGRELLDLLEAIEPGRRTILVMYALDGLRMSEIADALRIPVGTAYNRLRLARQDLRDAFARKEVSDEFGMFFTTWQKLLTVRDPWEYFYGRAAIEQPLRDRIWAGVLAAISRTFPTMEAAEVGALRVLSPIWKADAPPRPYPRLKRPQKPGGRSRKAGGSGGVTLTARARSGATLSPRARKSPPKGEPTGCRTP